MRKTREFLKKRRMIMKKIYKGALIAALLITMIATLFLPIFSIMDHEISLADFVYNVLQNTSNSLAELLQNQYTDYAIGVIILCVLFIAVLCLVIKIESITAYYIAINTVFGCILKFRFYSSFIVVGVWFAIIIK